jgi:hypothetical protein
MVMVRVILFLFFFFSITIFTIVRIVVQTNISPIVEVANQITSYFSCFGFVEGGSLATKVIPKNALLTQ